MRTLIGRNARALGLALWVAAAFASPAGARNRATELIISNLAAQQGLAPEVVLQRVNAIRGNDTVLAPGVLESIGGVASNFGGRDTTLLGVRLYNESKVAMCVRARATVVAGPFVGSRQSSRTGSSFLLKPGASEWVITNQTNSITELRGAHHALSYYFWLAGPGASDRTCAAGEPSALAAWLKEPMPSAGQGASKWTRDLRVKLGG